LRVRQSEVFAAVSALAIREEETVRLISSKRIGVGLLLCVALSKSAIASSAQAVESGRTIKLRAYNYANVGTRVAEGVQREVESIFNRMAVRVEWVTDDNPQFRIFIIQNTSDPAASDGDIFGFTPRNPDGTHSNRAFVLYARVQEFIKDSKSWREPPLEPVRLLAYFIAHEIGHLLLPPRSHSPIGIMRERWTDNDFKAMATANLNFTAEQVSFIRGEVLRLSQR